MAATKSKPPARRKAASKPKPRRKACVTAKPKAAPKPRAKAKPKAKPRPKKKPTSEWVGTGAKRHLVKHTPPGEWTARDKELDPWVDRRHLPVYAAVIDVLMKHEDVLYYSVEWRPFLYRPTCPKDAEGLRRGPRKRDPRAICGSMSKPYTHGGGGYLERFASEAARTLDKAPGMPLSEAVRQVLEEDYNRSVTHPGWDARLYGPRRKYGPLQLTFTQALRKFGWHAPVFRALDKRHAQLLRG